MSLNQDKANGTSRESVLGEPSARDRDLGAIAAPAAALHARNLSKYLLAVPRILPAPRLPSLPCTVRHSPRQNLSRTMTPNIQDPSRTRRRPSPPPTVFARNDNHDPSRPVRRLAPRIYGRPTPLPHDDQHPPIAAGLRSSDRHPPATTGPCPWKLAFTIKEGGPTSSSEK